MNREGVLYRFGRFFYHAIFQRFGISVPSYLLTLLTKKIGQDGELSYWKSYADTNSGRLPNKHYERLLCACANVKDINWFKDKRIVDIGCGPAGSLDWCKNAKQLIGLDPLSEKYIEFGVCNHIMVYLNCSAESIPLVSGSIDLVFSINSLDHVRRPKAVIGEARRILKKGGHLILSINLFEESNPREPYCFSPDIIRDLFAKDFELEWSKIGPHPSVIIAVTGYDGESFSPPDPLFGYQYMLYGGSAKIEVDTAKSHIMWCRYRAK